MQGIQRVHRRSVTFELFSLSPSLSSCCFFVSFYYALLLLCLAIACIAFHMRRQQFLTSISGAAFHLAYCEFYCFAVVYGTRSVLCKCLHSFPTHTHTHIPAALCLALSVLKNAEKCNICLAISISARRCICS